MTAGISGTHLHNYTGGIIRDEKSLRDLPTTHEVSIVGWGTSDGDDPDAAADHSISYWIVRNSHGEYWGELSFFRIEMGKSMICIFSHGDRQVLALCWL